MSCSTLLLATGVSYNRLTTEGADRLEGQGLYYGAAMTEAETCAGADVFIVGGANSAGQAAMYFAQKAASVTLVVRGESLELAMSTYLIEEIADVPTISVRTRTRITEFHGDDRLEAVTLVDDKAGTEERSMPERSSRSSARAPRPRGSTAPSPATRTASSSPGPTSRAIRRRVARTAGNWSASRTCWRRQCPESSSRATRATAR